jgi:quinol monooxygenase YgiN
MSAVKTIIKRKVPKGKEAELLPLLIELRTLAIAQPGYISGETLRNLDDPEEFVVIGTWKSFDDWKACVNIKRRIELVREIDALLGTKTEYAIYQYA